MTNDSKPKRRAYRPDDHITVIAVVVGGCEPDEPWRDRNIIGELVLVECFDVEGGAGVVDA
jgi:hypothetical protein